MKQGLLYSQIGYDIGDPMKAYFRSTEEEALKDSYWWIVAPNSGRCAVLRRP